MERFLTGSKEGSLGSRAEEVVEGAAAAVSDTSGYSHVWAVCEDTATEAHNAHVRKRGSMLSV